LGNAKVEAIRSLERRAELLAPAGRWDVLEAVVEAGADAVYLSGKRFQMRAHRKDFHFDDAALRDASAFLHEKGKRLYVTVNTLLGAHETDEMRAFLELLAEIKVDAAIVCDLGTIALANEMDAPFELHASTMMNVHDADQAAALRDLGIQRIVTSRDISIQDAGRLGERANIEIEYFLHGDMCVAQSGQCVSSGIAFGKSSNRGECMKPCRWAYDLVRLQEDGPSEPLAQGHLMALRDLALIRQIPDLIDAGVCGLKIEGRMRDAVYLRDLVALYRDALDQYYDWPAGYTLGADSLEKLFRQRVRDLSSLSATGSASNAAMFDISGKREPLILSAGTQEPTPEEAPLTDFSAPLEISPTPRPIPSLAVSVATLKAARAALDAGADRVYLAAETSQYGDQQWNAEEIRATLDLAASREAGLGMRLPRVSGNRSKAEWNALEGVLKDRPSVHLLVHHLGDLQRARKRLPHQPIIADYGLNTLNPRAARLLANLGAKMICPSLEAGFEDVVALAAETPLPLELMIHGPVTGMLLDHCVIAMNLSRSGSKDTCRGPCRQTPFALRDAKGAVRDIVTDQYCRNHLLTEKDVAILPAIELFLGLSVDSFRMEAQFYSPELTGRLTAAYRAALDAWKAGLSPTTPDCDALEKASPRSWNFGGYAQRVTRSVSTVEVMRSLK
jgi:U32 family peptidase